MRLQLLRTPLASARIVCGGLAARPIDIETARRRGERTLSRHKHRSSNRCDVINDSEWLHDLREDIRAAKTGDAIIGTLCRSAWVYEHLSPDPMPAHMGMTAREFRELLPHVRVEVRDGVALLFGTLYKTVGMDMPHKSVVRRCFESPVLKEIHGVWVQANVMASDHPVYEVVAAAMKLKMLVADLDRRRSGIQPAFLSAPAVPGNIVPSNIRLSSGALDACGFRSQPGTAWMFDLPEGVDGPAPAMLLALLDSNSDGPQRVPRVPIRDRLFCEAMMAAVPEHRLGTRSVNVSVREVVNGWLQWTYYRPSDPSTGVALSNALKALNDIYVPMNDRGGWWKPLNVPRCEGLRLDDRIYLSIYLPFDSNRGARVDRHALRVAGKNSVVAWRLYLSLCYEWNRIAWRGKVPHLTRPEVRRDESGYVLGSDGKVLTTKQGAPQKSPYDQRAVVTGSREPNPRGERLHRLYDSPADLVRLIWPLGHPWVARNRGRSERGAVQAAQWLARETGRNGDLVRLRGTVLDEPAIRIVRKGAFTKRNPHGFPWRIVRPHTL